MEVSTRPDQLVARTAHGPPSALAVGAAIDENPREYRALGTVAIDRGQLPKLRTRVRFPSPALRPVPFGGPALRLEQRILGFAVVRHCSTSQDSSTLAVRSLRSSSTHH